MFASKHKSQEVVTRLAALDSVRTNVMIADADYNIVYMNDGVVQLLTGAEKELQRDLPNFNASRLLGSNIDVFHKNPAHQRRMLDALKGTHNATITVGGRTFDLIAQQFSTQKAKNALAPWLNGRMHRSAC